MAGPLAGLHILVTRPEAQAEGLVAAIEAEDGIALRFPTLAILPPRSPERLEEALAALPGCELAIFTSANAVYGIADPLAALGGWPQGVRVVAVGAATARALQSIGVPVDLQPSADDERSEALLGLPALQDVDDQQILIVHGEGGRELLAETLTERGARVMLAESYRRALPPDAHLAPVRARLEAGQIDVITTTSNASLTNLFELLGKAGRESLLSTRLLVVSPRGAELAVKLGFHHPPIIATGAADAAVVAALVEWRAGAAADTPNRTRGPVMTDKTRDQAQPDKEPPKQPPAPAAKKPAAPAAPPPAKPAAGGGGALGGLALLVALAAAGGAGFLGYQWYQGRAAQQQQVADIDARIAAALQKGAADTSSAVAKLQSELDAARSELAAQAQRAADAQAGKLKDMGDKVEGLVLGQRGLLAEVEAAKTAAAKGDLNALTLSEVSYLLRVADHKLHFEADPAGALEALQVAEQRLAAANELAFAGVQKMLAENIATVRGVKLPDYAGIAHRIIELEGRVDVLAVKPDIQVENLKARVKPQLDSAVPEGEAPWYERMAENAWNQVKDIVVIRHERTHTQPLMTPKESFFLHQNLRLNLEAMRLALLRDDAVAYQESAQLVVAWLGQYFDQSDADVQQLTKDVQALAAVQLKPYVPDIHGTVKAFGEILSRRQPVRSATVTDEQRAGAVTGEASQ